MEFENFINKTGEIIGIDLTKYKRTQMERRINSLMRSQGFTNYQDYYHKLKEDPCYRGKFIDHLTINVSEFFRNSGQWHVLEHIILPEIINNNPVPKFWSAGCATGEEPYSLAIILREMFPNVRPTILATDIDYNILATAKQAVYKERSVVNVPPLYLAKYFVKKGNNYQLKQEIKDMVTFKKHDLLKDHFFYNCDLILCRNVMIYFTEETRNNLYRSFQDALRPGGILFTGSTEQIFKASQLGMEAVASFFYRKIS